MGEHIYPFQSYYKLNNDILEGNDTTYTLHKEILAQCVDLADREIVNAIVDAARENGVTDVYLIDKEFILRAIKNELERMKEETSIETSYDGSNDIRSRD